MPRRIGVSRNEMMELRKQGLSNSDIANLLEISKATVHRYIGAQGGRMDNLAAFNEHKTEKVETPMEEQKTSPKAVDSLEMIFEVVKSADGTFRAEIDYECNSVSILDSTVAFGELAELATFIVGLASRIEQKGKEL